MPSAAKRARSAAAECERPDKDRLSSRRKTEAVLRLFRGEILDALSRELGVMPSKLAELRYKALAAMQAGRQSRDSDHRDGLIHDLTAEVGDQAMKIELIERKIGILEDGIRPPPRRQLL